jgi:hypothetical protein
MRIAPESRPFLLAAVALTVVAWALGGWPWAVAPALGLLFTVYFFRDPRRDSPVGTGLVATLPSSPCDSDTRCH